MNLYEAKTPLLGEGGEFRLNLFSSFAANCLPRSGSLNFVKQEKVTRKGGLFLLSLRSTSAHSGKHIDRWRAAAIRNPIVRE